MNEAIEAQNDLLFDVILDDENGANDRKNVVKLDMKEEAREKEIKSEFVADEETSLS